MSLLKEKIKDYIKIFNLKKCLKKSSKNEKNLKNVSEKAHWKIKETRKKEPRKKPFKRKKKNKKKGKRNSKKRRAF